MNQELCDPMEKEFSTDWAQIMDSSIFVFLATAEAKLLDYYTIMEKLIVSALAEAGVKQDRLHALRSAASRTCTSVVKRHFREMKTVATDSQRDLNRSLLPSIQSRMKGGYQRALSAPGGSGVFNRMNAEMVDHTRSAVDTMFSTATKELLGAIDGLINRLSNMITASAEAMYKEFEKTFSILWEDQKNETGLVDPAQHQLVRQCRDKLLPSLGKLADIQGGALELLGMKRDDLAFEVVAVDSLEDRFQKAMEKAQSQGLVFDLCDTDDLCDADDDETVEDSKPAAKPSFSSKVKAEPRPDWYPSEYETSDDEPFPSDDEEPFPRQGLCS